MTREAWDPLRELAGVQQRMNRLFESAMARTNFDAEGGFGAWSPAADMYETGDSVVVSLELPGLALAEIDLRIDGAELVVEGERKMEREQPGEQFHRVERSYGKFQRRLALPEGIDREGARAAYRDGVLTVTLPKSTEARARRIRLSIE